MQFLPKAQIKHKYRRFGHGLAKAMGEKSTISRPPIVDAEDVVDSFGLNFIHDLISTSHYNLNGYFLGKKSIGFTLELNTITGSSEGIINDLTVLFRGLPEGSNIQCMLMADSRIGDFLDSWEAAGKTKNEFLMKLNSYMVKGLKDIRLNEDSPLRLFRLFLSFSLPLKDPKWYQAISDMVKPQGIEGKAEILLEQKNKIIKMLENKGFGVSELGSSELLTLLHNIMYPTNSAYSSNMKANPLDTIANQMTKPGGKLKVNKDDLEYSIDDDTWTIQSFSPEKLPDHWEQFQNIDLLGSDSSNLAQIPCPFIIHYGVHVMPRGLGEKIANVKGSMVIHQTKGNIGKWIKGLEREALEWDYVKKRQLDGDKFVDVSHSVVLFSRKTDAKSCASKLTELYRDLGWELRSDSYIHLLSLLSILPMNWCEGWYKKMRSFIRTKLALTHEIANFLPLQGECRGNTLRGVLFAGRRGGLFNFSNYETSTNMNAIVIGSTGSGKSFLMQNLMLSTLSRNGRVFIFDVGKSFRDVTVAMAEGAGHDAEHITFGKSNICINPFSNVCDDPSLFENADDYDNHMQDEFVMLNSIVYEMAAPNDGVTDLQRACLTEAVAEAWNKHKQETNITKIADILLAKNNQVDNDLGRMLYPFTKEGPYGKYFEGKANVTFRKQLSVIELEELKSRKDLQAVVLKILMLQISNQILGDERQLSQIVMDECWDLLRGNQTGAFMEALARKIRKYGGGLLCGTQKLDDFIGEKASIGAQAVHDSSDFAYIMQQKKDTIRRLINSNKITADEAAIYRSIKTIQGVYSEVCIKTEDGMAIGRLRSDPFSKLLFSTQAHDTKAINEKLAQGMTTEQAVDAVLQERAADV